MAAHVAVIDFGLQQRKISVNPSKTLNEVRNEACQRLRDDPSNYGLKHKGKPLDLSLTFRQSGLSSGAKLELITVSKSPSVVSVALQHPDGNRQVLKVPSNTTLWKLLRKFESDEGKNINITARGIAAMQDGSSGQLNYEAPTLRIMNKEYTEFEDLQKTLAQIGVNSGNILINLRYSKKDKPLYVAMEEIGRFFQDFDGETTPTPSQPKAEQPPQSPVQVPLPATLSVQQQASPKQASPPRPSPPRMTPQATESSSSHLNRPRNLEVHAAPTSTTPLATQTGFDEDAYVPTIADAKRHQAALENRGKNQRLLSDAEIAALEAEKLAKKKSVIETKVRIRFPDETMVTLTVSISDTGADLYTFVRDLLEPNKQRERFWLVYRGKRPNERLEDGKVSLIGDLGWSGPTLVNFVWDDSASAGARKGPALKEEHRRDAKPVEVPKAGLGETAGSGSGRSGASPGPSTEAASAKPKDERSKEEKLRTLLGKGKGLFGKK